MVGQVFMSRTQDSLELIKQALAGLKFGEVVIAIHDGEIVQIARTEKLRPARKADSDNDRL